MTAVGRRGTRWLIAFGIVVVAVIVLRVLLAGIVRDQLNARLDRMGSYHGHVDTVRIHLWRGAYSLHGLNIVKLGGAAPVPFFKSQVLDLSIDWGALFSGGIVAKAEFDRPEVNFVDAGSEAGAQSGKGADWRAQLEALLPIRLDEVVIHDGVVTFRNFSSKPPVDLRATKLEATIRNLTNVRRKDGGRVAEAKGTAALFGEAPARLEAKFDPFGRPDTFELSFTIDKVQLTRANDLIRAYAGLDIASGTGSFTLELQAKKGHVEGYAKPLFTDLKIFSWKQDVEQDQKNVFSLAYEALAEGVTKLFTNFREDQFGTRIPISGEVGDTRVGTIEAVYGIVRNAFVEAYKPGFEQAQKQGANPDRKPDRKP